MTATEEVFTEGEPVKIPDWWLQIEKNAPMPQFNDPDPACVGTDPEIFFAKNKFDDKDPQEAPNSRRAMGKRLDPLKIAKELCKSCAHMEPCRDFAVKNNFRYGIWGGTTERERRVLRKLLYG